MEIKFNSQICTSRSQSERLLKLGLKKETADMTLLIYSETIITSLTIPYVDYEQHMKTQNISTDWIDFVIPAWSLHRVKELYKCVGDTSLWNLDDVNYDRLIQCIGLAIKHNSFNKEYLV